MNSLLAEFIQGLDQRFPDDSSVLPMSDWVCANTTLRRKAFSFKGFEFQRQIIDDMHPDLSCIKLSQVGLTESQMRKFFGFLKRNPGTAGIFSLPNQPMRDRLSQTRIKMLIESDPIWNGPLADKPVRHKALYQVDDSYGYITGTTEGEATSISADILMEDEVDLADQAMRGLMQSRLQMSKFKITQRFSTPTYVGYGIDAAYNVSDKHEYQYRCPCCNEWQIPLFAPRFLCLPGLTKDVDDLSKLTIEDVQGIDLDNAYVRCTKCSAPVDLSDPSLRQWVAENPFSRARGYRVRPFSVDSITIPYIFGQLKKYQLADNLKGFFNTVLGEPFNDANARISEEDIRVCMQGPAIPDPKPSGGYFLGCDVGQTCHVTIGTPNHIVEFAQVPQAELVGFIKGRVESYKILGGAIDLYPMTSLSEQVRDVTRGVVMPIGYATVGTAPAMQEKKDEFDKVTHYVANRTKMIDAVARVVRQHLLLMSGFGGNGSLLVTHLRDMIRIEKPDEPPAWEKLSGNDHFLHSLALHQASVRLKAGIDFNSTADPRTGIMLRGEAVLQDTRQSIYRGVDYGTLY